MEKENKSCIISFRVTAEEKKWIEDHSYRNAEKQNQMDGSWTACRIHEIAHQQGCQRGEEQV